jgi:transmembrane sensor
VNSPRQRLALAVQPPEVTEARIARQWASIERRLPPRGYAAGRRGAGFYAACGALPLLAAGFIWYASQERAVPSVGAVIESSRTPVTVTLRDGSSLALGAQTKLHLLRDEPDAVDVDLGSGKAGFDVTHVAGRTFRVHAGLVVVRVIGTRFEVARTGRGEGDHIQIAVARGVVEVQRRDGKGDVRRLNAGETWSALIPSPSVPPASQPEPARAAEDPVDRSALPASPSSAAEPPPSTSTLLPSDPARAERAAVLAARRASAAGLRAARAAREQARSASAADLWVSANLARRSGQMLEAADGYAELLKRFSQDKRAGLAAFELGRIRMDALTQPQAAIEAFNTALRAAPRASFREDALARIVVAYDMMGEREACLSARDRYQDEFPAGVHALALASRCGR